MEEFKCTGECIKCSLQQQVYCAAQHGHGIMAVMPAIIERLDLIERTMLKQNGAVVNPIAQEAAGAENRAEEQTQ